jgi:hypothetical protein
MSMMKERWMEVALANATHLMTDPAPAGVSLREMRLGRRSPQSLAALCQKGGHA